MAASCNIKFQTLVNVAGDSGAFAAALPKHMDNATTIELLDFLHDNSKLDLDSDRYKLGQKIMQQRPSNLAGKLYEYHGGQDRLALPDTAIQTDAGTLVHEIAASAGKLLTEKLKPGDVVTQQMIGAISRQLMSIVDNYPGTTKMDINAVNVVAATVAQLINTALETQQSINSKVLPTFRFEHRLLNPIKDIGGTGDMLVVYSDNTASYFDYKTFEPVGNDKGWDKEGQYNYVKNYGAYRSYRREKWEVSIPAYIQILKDTYKIAGIRHARAVPVATFFKKTPEYVSAVESGNKLKMEQLQAKGLTRQPTVTTVETFVVGSSMLLPAVIQPEATGDNVLDKFIADRYKEIEQLRRAGGSSEARARNKARIEELQLAIDRLTTAKDISAILDLANKLVIEASELLRNMSENKPIDNRLESIRVLRNELSYYKDIADLTARYLSTTNDKALMSKVNSVLGEVLTKMSIAKSALDTVYLNEMSANNLIHGGITKEELDAGTIMFEQDDVLQKWAKGASNSNNPFLVQMKAVHDKLEKQKRDMLEQFEKDSEKYFTGLQEFMKQIGWNESQFIKFIVNKRGNLVHKFSSEMYDLINTAVRERNSSFFLQNFTVKENYEASYERRLARKDIELRAKFNINDEAKESTIKRYQEALASWIEDNALFINGNINDAAWSKQSNVRYFLKRKPEFENAYYSEQYKFMVQHPKLREWYDFWQRTMYSAKEMLGGNEKVTANLVPWVAKDALELAVARNGMVAQDMLNAIAMNQDDPTEEYDAFGNLVKSVPILYLSPFKRKTAEGKFEDDLDKKSFNLQKSLMLFMEMAINYDLKTKSEASVMAIKDMMIDFGQVYQLTKQGHVIIDPTTGQPKTGTQISDDIVKVFDDYMNFYWYGMRISTKDKTVNAFGREVSVQKSLLAAKNMYARKVLAFSLHAPLASWAVGRAITVVQGSKGLLFYHSMHANAVKWWAESKATTFGSSSANGKKYKAFLTYFDPQNESLVDRISDRYQASRIDKYLGNRAQFAFFHHADEAVIDILAISIAQNYGIKDGVLRHKDKLGDNDKSLWELFTISEKDGEVTMDIQLPDSYTEQQKKDIKDAIWIKYRKIVREAQRSVIGSISDEEISLLSTNLYGNLALQFRTWLPNVAYEMFKGLKYDETYDAVDIGRLTALADSFKGLDRKSGLGQHGMYMISTMAKLLGEVLFIGRVFGYDRQLVEEERARNVYEQWKEKHPQLSKNVSYEEYVQARRRQMIALVSQLRMLAMLSMLMMVVSMDWDDDDEKDYRQTFASRHGFRILNRVYTEFASMLNPGELNKLISGGPIPTWGLITSVAKLFNNTFDEVRDSIVGENSSQDETPFFYYTIDFIPLLDRLRKIMELTDADKRSTR